MKPFELTEEEFYKLKDATRAMQLMAHMHEQAAPAKDREQEQYCAFLYLMIDSLSCPVDGVLERQRLAQEKRRKVAEREADAAIADGRLPAEKREVAINIGDCTIDRLRAWLSREDVPGLMPLPALHLTEAQ